MPELREIGHLPYIRVEMGWIRPMWPSMPWAAKQAPFGKKSYSLAVPLNHGPNNRELFQKVFLTFSGAFGDLRAGRHIS